METPTTPPPPPKKIIEATKEELIQEAERIEIAVYNFEIMNAKKVGMDIGRAATYREIAKEME